MFYLGSFCNIFMGYCVKNFGRIFVFNIYCLFCCLVYFAISNVWWYSPEKKNCFKAEALDKAFTDFEADDSLCVAVLYGDGGTFCAGAGTALCIVIHKKRKWLSMVFVTCDSGLVLQHTTNFFFGSKNFRWEPIND